MVKLLIMASQRGVMAISPLADNLNLVDAIPVNYMHAILEGIMKKLMELLFNSKSHGKVMLSSKITRIN